jgi:hypothetical protein
MAFPCNADRSFPPSGVPHPVHASQPGPAANWPPSKPSVSLLPTVMSRNTPLGPKFEYGEHLSPEDGLTVEGRATGPYVHVAFTNTPVSMLDGVGCLEKPRHARLWKCPSARSKGGQNEIVSHLRRVNRRLRSPGVHGNGRVDGPGLCQVLCRRRQRPPYAVRRDVQETQTCGEDEQGQEGCEAEVSC